MTFHSCRILCLGMHKPDFSDSDWKPAAEFLDPKQSTFNYSRSLYIYKYVCIYIYMVLSPNSCSQNEGNLYRAPYYNGNPNIGPHIIGNLHQYPYTPKGYSAPLQRGFALSYYEAEGEVQILTTRSLPSAAPRRFRVKGSGLMALH